MKDRADESARSPKFDGYQSTLVSTANNFFDRKTGSGVSVNEQVAEELLQPVIWRFKRGKVCQIQRQYLALCECHHCLLRIRTLDIYYVP